MSIFKPILILIIIAFTLAGCANYSKEEYYADGQVKTREARSGFVNWSDGPGKTINFPLSNPAINGIGK